MTRVVLHEETDGYHGSLLETSRDRTVDFEPDQTERLVTDGDVPVVGEWSTRSSDSRVGATSSKGRRQRVRVDAGGPDPRCRRQERRHGPLDTSVTVVGNPTKRRQRSHGPSPGSSTGDRPPPSLRSVPHTQPLRRSVPEIWGESEHGRSGSRRDWGRRKRDRMVSTRTRRGWTTSHSYRWTRGINHSRPSVPSPDPGDPGGPRGSWEVSEVRPSASWRSSQSTSH